jgi:hypothetical protein
MWLAVKLRLWTTDRRARHDLQEEADICALCLQEPESAEHVIIQCVFARQVWHSCLGVAHFNIAAPLVGDQLESWWLQSRRSLNKRRKKIFDTWVTLVCWSFWKQRNARIFGDQSRQCDEDVLAARIVEDMKLWSMAGLGSGEGGNGVEDPG